MTMKTNSRYDYGDRLPEQLIQRQPGRFAGWICERWGVAWIISDARKDKRAGVINGQPVAANVYVLQFTARDGHKYNRGQFKRIKAPDDNSAAAAARALLSGVTIREEWRKSAQLFFDEREIAIW